MKVFLCGGGADVQTVEANKRLNEVIDHSKPCLYIPLAMAEDRYDSCYEWLQGELKDVDIPAIHMVRSVEELGKKNFADYSFLFIGGGNTFKLLRDIKVGGSFEKIREYLENGGVAFGGSAGAIIFGKDLEACVLDDSNDVNLTDIDGYDVLDGISVLCHFGNRTEEKDEASRRFLLDLSLRRKAVALPEEVTLFVNDDKVEVIGNRSFYLFENGVMVEKKENWE
jgi:dipeptidase E